METKTHNLIPGDYILLGSQLEAREICMALALQGFDALQFKPNSFPEFEPPVSSKHKRNIGWRTVMFDHGKIRQVHLDYLNREPGIRKITRQEFYAKLGIDEKSLNLHGQYGKPPRKRRTRKQKKAGKRISV